MTCPIAPMLLLSLRLLLPLRLALAAHIDSCGSGAREAAWCSGAGGDAAQDDPASLMQLGRATRGERVRVDASADGGAQTQPAPLDPVGEFEAGKSTEKEVIDIFFPHSGISDGPNCNRSLVDCLNETVRQACPKACSTEEDLLGLVKSNQRGFNAGALQARNRIVSHIQSSCEKRYSEIKGAGKKLPEFYHTGLLAFDKALENIRTCGQKVDNRNPHLTDLGYPLTVVEAILFQLNLTDQFIQIPRGTSNAALYLAFAEVVEAHGWDSREAKDYYAKALYLTGENGLPVDIGWVNEFLAVMQLYAFNWGIHNYRQCPWKMWPMGYDESFAVHTLPDEAGIRIGLLADWGAGSPQSLQLIQEMKKQGVDMVIHLGDTYYSGEEGEARAFFKDPLQAVFGKDMTLLQVPGNHDYYSGGAGFFKIIDELGFQQASFFCLRGQHWQIVALDTGLMDNFNLLFGLGNEDISELARSTLTFLPEDQAAWARAQLAYGRKHGLKTVMMSHHQFISRGSTMGSANGPVFQASTMPDRLKMTYMTSQFETASEDLPGHLPAGSNPSVNTRLLHQLGEESIGNLTAWFWGHEHAAVMFEPYAGLERGRLIGNGAIGEPVETDPYGESNGLVGDPWGGLPRVIKGTEVGKGDAFWNLGFAIMGLDGDAATVEYFQMQDAFNPPSPPTWGAAERYHVEVF